MKAIGDWILVEPLRLESDSGILSSAMDRGKVIAVSDGMVRNGCIQIGDIAIFDLNKVGFKHPDFWAIDFKWVFAIQ